MIVYTPLQSGSAVAEGLHRRAKGKWTKLIDSHYKSSIWFHKLNFNVARDPGLWTPLQQQKTFTDGRVVCLFFHSTLLLILGRAAYCSSHHGPPSTPDSSGSASLPSPDHPHQGE